MLANVHSKSVSAGMTEATFVLSRLPVTWVTGWLVKKKPQSEEKASFS